MSKLDVSDNHEYQYQKETFVDVLRDTVFNNIDEMLLQKQFTGRMLSSILYSLAKHQGFGKTDVSLKFPIWIEARIDSFNEKDLATLLEVFAELSQDTPFQ